MRPQTHGGLQGRRGLHRRPRQDKMYGVSWTRYDGRALADITLPGGALRAELEDYIRLRNPHFTDIRLEHATATEGYHTSVRRPIGCWPRARALVVD